MTPFECYTMYSALKAHFSTPAYDYFKYNGKLKNLVNRYKSCSFKPQLQKLSKNNDVKNFFIGNLIKDIDFFPLDLEKAEIVARGYSKRLQALEHSYKEDLKQFGENFNKAVLIIDDKLPIVVQNGLNEKIHIVSLVLFFNAMPSVKNYFDKKIEKEEWKTLSNKIDKLSPFIEIDTKKIKTITKNFFLKEHDSTI